MKKLAAIDEKVKFKKQVPVHPRDRLRKLSKKLTHSRDTLKKQINVLNILKIE